MLISIDPIICNLTFLQHEDPLNCCLLKWPILFPIPSFLDTIACFVFLLFLLFAMVIAMVILNIIAILAVVVGFVTKWAVATIPTGVQTKRHTISCAWISTVACFFLCCLFYHWLLLFLCIGIWCLPMYLLLFLFNILKVIPQNHSFLKIKSQ